MSEYAYPMPKGATGPASEFSQHVADRVASVRDDRGVSTTELAESSGMSRNYLYMRLRGDAPFTTNDIEALAGALDVDPVELMTGVTTGSAHSGAIRIDPAELRVRVDEMVEARYGALAPEQEAALVAATDLPQSTWAVIRSGQGDAAITRGALTALAAHFEVDDRFLLDSTNWRVADAVRARLELEKVLRLTGAQRLHTRALGEASPDALRAVARALSASLET